MKKIILLIFLLNLFTINIYAQNIDYNSRITQFYGDCNESGTEEYTWKGWLSDNVNTAETYSGCITRNNNGAVTQTGTYATRNRTNTSATQIRTRIDGWEDDRGNRCDYDSDSNPFNNDDDCRANQTCTFNFTGPLEYQYTSVTSPSCGSGDINMRTFYEYRYATTTLPAATEYTATSFTTGGTRPFWGSRGSWASVGSDCATSGTITHNQTSSFSTTVSCKSQVTFRWRVASEANFDFLRVFVNGVQRQQISGTTTWAGVTLNLDYGSNVVEWRYTKDGSVSSGDDRGFVDQISFTNATTMQAGTVTGSQTICSGLDPSNLASTVTPQIYSNSAFYQWQYSNNGITGWTNIGGAIALSYNPPTGLTQTRHYRRRTQDGCGNTGYSNVVIVTVNPLPNGNLSGSTTICEGNSTNLVFNSTAGSGPWDIVYNGTTLNNITSGTNIPVSPISTTIYALSSVTDDNGCVRTSGLGSSATMTVNTNSTAPAIAAVPGTVCPNTSLNLTASGGIAGTNSFIRWYSGPNGTGTFLGTGASLSVSPLATTTYYSRREGLCNNTTDASRTVNVKSYAYTPVGATTSNNYCTDNDGWHQFYNASNEVVFSIQGDLTGAPVGFPSISISNNGSSYSDIGTPGSCATAGPGEAKFEMQRNWNVDFGGGTLNPPYNVRFYYTPAEKTAIETAAANHITTYPSCSYSYKYPTPNGFYWFKNVGASYTAGQYDGTQLSGTNSSINGLTYVELTGITSFSGGSGGITLSTGNTLPVEMVSFTAASKENKAIQLNWITATEVNNEGFEIERSTDGLNFQKIAWISGNGNVSKNIDYSYLDKEVENGIEYYYRLKQVDFDGAFEYSKIVNASLISNDNVVVSYFIPNPSTDVSSLVFDVKKDVKIQIEILDNLGRLISITKKQLNGGKQTIKFDLKEYPTGIYTAKILLNDNEFTRKLVVRK